MILDSSRFVLFVVFVAENDHSSAFAWKTRLRVNEPTDLIGPFAESPSTSHVTTPEVVSSAL